MNTIAVFVRHNLADRTFIATKIIYDIVVAWIFPYLLHQYNNFILPIFFLLFDRNYILASFLTMHGSHIGHGARCWHIRIQLVDMYTCCRCEIIDNSMVFAEFLEDFGNFVLAGRRFNLLFNKYFFELQYNIIPRVFPPYSQQPAAQRFNIDRRHTFFASPNSLALSLSPYVWHISIVHAAYYIPLFSLGQCTVTTGAIDERWQQQYPTTFIANRLPCIFIIHSFPFRIILIHQYKYFLISIFNFIRGGWLVLCIYSLDAGVCCMCVGAFFLHLFLVVDLFEEL